jgi:hypothetical protein
VKDRVLPSAEPAIGLGIGPNVRDLGGAGEIAPRHAGQTVITVTSCVLPKVEHATEQEHRLKP